MRGHLRTIIVLLATALTARAQSTVPVATQALPGQMLATRGGATTIDLRGFFGVPGVSGSGHQVVQFDTVLGKFNVMLREDAAPNHVFNFLQYVNALSYNDSIFHRLANLSGRGVPQVLQGGEFKASPFMEIVTTPPVDLEYNLPNALGTLAAARTSALNSATSQWYFNLTDNSTSLGQTGNGYTVFGQVIGTGMRIVNGFGAWPTVSDTILGSRLETLPVFDSAATPVTDDANLAVINSISVIQIYPGAGTSLIQFAVQNSASSVVTAALSGSTLSLTPLSLGTAYVTVTATDINGNPASSRFSVTVVALLPSAAPANPTFGIPTATADGFTVQITNYNPANGWVGRVDSGTVAISGTGLVTVTGVAAATRSTATITTAGNSWATVTATALAAPVTPGTAPGVPTAVSVVGGNAQAIVSFTAPTNNGGAAITNYSVIARPVGAGTAVLVTGLASPITVTGLTNGTAYTFTVSAVNGNGVSTASSASSEVTPVTAPGAPTAVSGVSGNGQVTVSFTPPTNNGGAAIMLYSVIAQPVGGGTAVIAQDRGSPITVTGLTNGTAYTFTVLALSRYFVSSASSPSSVVTPALPVVITAPPSRFASFSVLGYTGAGGSDTLTLGLAFGGSDKNPVMVRGLGPALTALGLPGAIADPKVEVFSNGGRSEASNDNWSDQAGLIGATLSVGLRPLQSGSRDAAVMLEVTPSSGPYTIDLTSTSNPDTGWGMIELYPILESEISGVSARGQVGKAGKGLTVGFRITDSAKTVIVRGLGPNLASAGVRDFLVSVRLTLLRTDQDTTVEVASNDNWGGDPALSAAFKSVGLVPLQPGSEDAALLLKLEPGVYTLQLSGVNGATGTGMIELYALPAVEK